MAKIDLISNAWCDLVFEGRNKTYGAYALRKGTGKRNTVAILMVLIVAVLGFSALQIKNAIEANRKVAITTGLEASKLIEKKPEVKKKAPVEIEKPKEVVKVKSSVKFTAPVIKKDSEVKPEEEMKSQEDLTKTNTAIGAFDVKGNSDEGTVLKAEEEIAQPEPPKVEENKVFDVVEQQPQFPGGMAALNSWLRDNMEYPVVAAEAGIQGRVVVQFVVEKDGSVSGAHVVRSVDPALDREALRVVSKMPNWIPGKQNGSAVRVKYTVPVTFRLQ
ncbi:MAG: energy transducer TonB [Prevotella sp.]|nr:energy transducer TonB [Prevotella sp.]MBQ4631925.1 energy transducer TonB [Prevotella sp.]MBQ8628494.1 energy transducer TonB [Prevotella sp.]